jgi:hypothetical protein
MFKKGKAGFLAGAAVLLILLPVFFGCDNDAGDGSPTPITYTVAEDGGVSYTTDSTAIKFTFSAAVDGLADSDITLGAGATAGTLTGSEKSYSLAITVVNAGQVTVKIAKTGIEAGTKTVVVHKQGKVTPGEAPPEGINGFPSTLTMGVPFNLRENITINLPDAPDKTFDDIIWARNTSGAEFASTQVVIEDDLFIPVTFFTSKVKVYAIVRDGEGEGFDYTEEFETNIVFPLNPFIGSWSGSDGKTWKFNTDGTYGIDTVANFGSFAVWSGQPGRKFLVTVSGDPDTITVDNVVDSDPDNGAYQPYCFEQTGNTITITPISFTYTDATNKQDPMQYDIQGTPITLTKQSGEPAALDLSKNYSSLLMIGGWSGNFAANPFNPDSDTITIGASPSITYYADGRVQQNYEGAWLKRGAVFVTVGNDGRRWDPPALASWDTVTAQAEAIKGKQVVRIGEKREYSRSTNQSLNWRLVRFLPQGQPSDPHVPLVNPLTGVWKESESSYWKFNSDGTGGKATTSNGTFDDDFNFLFWSGDGDMALKAPASLVILEDDNNTVKVTNYGFSIATENATTTATLTASGSSITLEKVSGEPAALTLTNQFIGEHFASWPSGAIWSIKYRADGTVMVYHHQAGHQFDNAYAIRGDTLVIFGQMRFASAPIAAGFTQVGNTLQATEKSTAATKWTYTKVDRAEWK